jgi:hypothetical protein
MEDATEWVTMPTKVPPGHFIYEQMPHPLSVKTKDVYTPEL